MINEYRLCADINRCLMELEHNGRLAVAISHKHATSNSKIPNRAIYCFAGKEIIYNYPISMFIHENHPMTTLINDNIRRAFEGGLFRKWKTDHSINFNPKVDSSARPFQLGIDHLFTPVALFTVFACFAFGAFIAEIIVHYHIQKHNCGRFWKIADMLIDADRHFLVRK